MYKTATFESINASTNVRSETMSYTDDEGASIIVPRSLFQDTFKPPEPDILPLVKDLEDLKQTESRYLWHSITLSEYWSAKRIPRGLRLNKIPSFGLDDKSFMQKWEQILNKCSLDLMLLVIEKTKSEQVKLSAEVKRVEDELKSKTSADAFTGITERISTALSGFVKELQAYKINKYERDTRDYANGAVYNWIRRKNKKFSKSNRPPLPRRMTSRYTTLSTASEGETSGDVSDTGSIGPSSSNSVAFLDRGYRQRGQRRGAARGGRRDRGPPTRWSPRNHERRL